jgi:hypothetical protein
LDIWRVGEFFGERKSQIQMVANWRNQNLKDRNHRLKEAGTDESFSEACRRSGVAGMGGED